jgi:MFS family permease
MKIKADFSTLKKTKWYEYAIRFTFGGLVTVGTGIIAKKFGPSIGGLFLAFPAIFPASLSLIAKHTKEKRERAGIDGANRGRAAAALDAKGGAMGALGLLCFALVAAQWLPKVSAWQVLPIAVVVWFLVSGSAWRLRKAIKHGKSRLKVHKASKMLCG